MESPDFPSYFSFMDDHDEELQLPPLVGLPDLMTPVMTPEPQEEAAAQQEPDLTHEDNHESAHDFEPITPEPNEHEQLLMEPEPQGSAATSDGQQTTPNQEPQGSATTSDEVVQDQEPQNDAVTITVTMNSVHGQACEHHWGTCDHICDTQDQAGTVITVPNACGVHYSACTEWCNNHDDSEATSESLLPKLQTVKTYWSCTEESASSSHHDDEEASVKRQMEKVMAEMKELKTWISTFGDGHKSLSTTLSTVMSRHHLTRHDLAVARAKIQEMEVSNSMMVFNLSMAETAAHMYKKQLTEAQKCIDKLRHELRAIHENNLALRDSVYTLENIVTDSTSDHTPF